ncbi:voltage-gated chloride channel protein [Mucilaginibacter sp. PPCGB 2223]|uniref:voltage-gated chloride channel family protein n=1 Tax=Mucilaginibacter sp. PPCGB 2223 TaxID=1886027 RepID=UPI000825A9D3|nr:voltage-gated chloride channel family protein [Mucilaginibacter sp. PPCGB 2223]OCX50336.1 voltage-gated chloride channel protein [Mucilaginibacter sp. PPCGB 2223]
MLKPELTNRNFLIRYITHRILLVIPVAAAIGSMVALFLWLLSRAIHYRFQHTWLLYCLPLAGIAIHFAYKLYGKSAEKGNNLIIDEIHRPGAGVPKRMAPLILVTTVVTHLFGGSAGREGTAVQIGGSVAHFFADLFKLDPVEMRTMLTAGIAAGFGAVFGTPLTGAIFAVEVLTLNRVHYSYLLPCLVAGYTGDVTVSAWHIKHTPYHIDYVAAGHYFDAAGISGTLLLFVKVVFAAILFGTASIAFAEVTHRIKKFFLKLISITWLIPVCGAFIIIGLTLALGKPDYLSLGVEPEYPGAVTIVSAFAHGGAGMLSWFWKLLYTAITLGTGFKGGEVTPLFYIGATLGNTLAGFLNAPVSLFAALGFIAVFSGATKTPVACTIMGVELFGSEHVVFFAIACFVAYLASGHSGIYPSQKNGVGPAGYFKIKLGRYKL